jgi:taurine dioxygenase
MKINKLSPLFAAEVIGLDLETPPDEASFGAVKAAFEENSVLVVRGLDRLSPAAQVAFSRRFGPLEIHVMRQFLLADHPEILLVSNETRDGKPIGLADAGRYWHSDLSYMAEPSLGSFLLSRVRPAEGGDTLFASMHAAYDLLPESLKKRIGGLRAEHSYAAQADKRAAAGERPPLTPEQRAAVPPVIHPVVRRHEATGRPALFVNEGFTTRILGISEAESTEILEQLFAAARDPAIQYRHVWRDGDMVMWDNRAVIHLATGCPPEMARTLHRTTIRGIVPLGMEQEGIAA